MGLPGGVSQNINLRFKITFDQANQRLVFTDVTDYDSFTAIESILGIVKVVSPIETVYQNEGWQTVSFDSPDVTSGILSFAIENIDCESNFDTGLWQFFYKVQATYTTGGTDVFSVSPTYKYTFTPPTPDITPTFSKITSILTLTDSTVYDVVYDDYNDYSVPTGTPSPNTVTTTRTIQAESNVDRLLTIVPPYKAGSLTTKTGTTSSLTIGPNCYTGSYQLRVNTNPIYKLATWGSLTWIEVQFNLFATDNTVLEDTLNCFDYYATQITAINEKYLSLVGSNPREAEAYKQIRDNIGFYHNLFQIYEQIDEDTDWICTALEDILRKSGYLPVSHSTLPVEILPLATATTTTTDPNKWLNGVDTPADSLGSNDDFYLDTNTSKVYKKATGTWVYQMTIQGSGNNAKDNVTVTSDYTSTDDDDLILVDSSYNTVDIQLAQSTAYSENKILKIKAKKLTNRIRILAYNGETIETTSRIYQIGSEGDTIELQLVGTNWEVI